MHPTCKLEIIFFLGRAQDQLLTVNLSLAGNARFSFSRVDERTGNALSKFNNSLVLHHDLLGLA